VSSSPLAIGVDVGGTSIKLGVVRDDGTILHQNSLPTPAAEGPDAVLETIAGGVKSLLATHGSSVAGIGIGVPGVINNDGEISYPPNFPGWGIVPVAKRLRPLIGTDLPIAVENDANVAAYAELFGGEDSVERDFLFVTLGTGVGGCIISGGRIWRGASGGAGEVGHLSVDMNGQLCNCGSRGCVEAYLGQRYMSAIAAARLVRFPESSLHRMIADGRELEPKLLHEAAQSGDRFAQDFLEEMGMILGVALASMMNACDLHLVIVGGGTARSEQYLLEPARRSLRARLLKSIAGDVRLQPARFSNEAGIIGAAMLGMNRETSPPAPLR
jgi:glucokinase